MGDTDAKNIGFWRVIEEKYGDWKSMGKLIQLGYITAYCVSCSDG